MISRHKPLTTWTFHTVSPLFQAVPEYPETVLHRLFRNAPDVIFP